MDEIKDDFWLIVLLFITGFFATVGGSSDVPLGLLLEEIVCGPLGLNGSFSICVVAVVTSLDDVVEAGAKASKLASTEDVPFETVA